MIVALPFDFRKLDHLDLPKGDFSFLERMSSDDLLALLN